MKKLFFYVVLAFANYSASATESFLIAPTTEELLGWLNVPIGDVSSVLGTASQIELNGDACIAVGVYVTVPNYENATNYHIRKAAQELYRLNAHAEATNMYQYLLSRQGLGVLDMLDAADCLRGLYIRAGERNPDVYNTIFNTYTEISLNHTIWETCRRRAEAGLVSLGSR